MDDTFSKASKVALVFHGLDTFATIFINNDLVGTSENMFVKYVFDVKKNLKVNYLLKIFLLNPEVTYNMYNTYVIYVLRILLWTPKIR